MEDHGQAYVMAVTSQQQLWVNFQRQRVDAIIDDVPDEQWQTHSIGEGAKGSRVYQWAGGKFGDPIEHERGDLQNWLLVRRNVEQPTQRAYYFCAAPLDATLQDLAMAAGQRWAIETCFQTAKQEVGLDAYEVRLVDGLASPCHVVDVGVGVLERRAIPSAPAHGKRGVDLVPVTEPEIRRLMLAIVWPRFNDVERALAWSAWRRHHQAVAKYYHYRAREPDHNAQL